MTIQKANSNDHEILTAITKKSKANWGYSDEQIEIWSQLLTVTKAYIESNSVYKAVIEGEAIGYYSYFNEDENTIKLDNLFLLPKYMSKGIGRLIMEDFLFRIKRTDANRILLDSDPNAEKFYAKFGFLKIGQIATPTQGRYLPIMELKMKKG